MTDILHHLCGMRENCGGLDEDEGATQGDDAFEADFIDDRTTPGGTASQAPLTCAHSPPASSLCRPMHWLQVPLHVERQHVLVL